MIAKSAAHVKAEKNAVRLYNIKKYMRNQPENKMEIITRLNNFREFHRLNIKQMALIIGMEYHLLVTVFNMKGLLTRKAVFRAMKVWPGIFDGLEF